MYSSTVLRAAVSCGGCLSRRLSIESLESRRLLNVHPAWFEATSVHEAPLLSLAADADNSGVIDLADFGTLKQNFGNQVGSSLGDFDGDGTVSIGDFGILKQSFGESDQLSRNYAWDGNVVEKVENRWIVKLTPGALEGLSGPMDAMEYFDPDVVQILGGLGQQGLLLVETQTDDAETVASLFGDPNIVVFYEPELVDELLGDPDDADFSLQWGMTTINAPDAWDTSTGNRDIVVAVIDSGVDYEHDDLAANMWTNPSEIPGNGFDDDNNGFVDDVFGYDHFNEDGDPRDDNGHGTHVAGIVGAVGNNGIGVAGVNQRVSIMPIKAFGSDGLGTSSTSTRAINYAVMMKNQGANVRVINTSYGNRFPSAAEAEAISSAAASDILIVASAGSDGADTDLTPHFPSSYAHENNIIAVANTDLADQLFPTSNFGLDSVDIAAPGTGIWSTLPDGNYGFMSGASMAASHVAGAAALLADQIPDASSRGLRSVILNHARTVPSLVGAVATGGILDLGSVANLDFAPVSVRPHFLMPDWIDGDDPDFEENGPAMDITTEIRISADGTRLETQVEMSASEIGGDTRALGRSIWETAYVAPHGRTILDIAGLMISSISHDDEDFAPDILPGDAGDGDLVHHYEIIGDTDGDDAGGLLTPPFGKTGVRVHYNDVEILLSEPVSPSTVACRVELEPLHVVGTIAPPTPGGIRWIRGDQDFDSGGSVDAPKGPLMDTFVDLRLNDGDIEGRVYLHAQEWQAGLPHADHTTFDGWSDWHTLYSGNVTQVHSEMFSRITYVDTDHDPDYLYDDGPATDFMFVGDVDGLDLPEAFVQFRDMLVEEPGCGENKDVHLRPHFFMPSVTEGDADLGSNPAAAIVSVDLRINPVDPTRLETRVGMSVDEVGGDTRADGTSSWETAYVAPEGRTITGINSETSLIEPITDSTADDGPTIVTVASGLVDTLEYIGNEPGGDIGVHTRVRVHFNTVNIDLTPAPVVGPVIDVNVGPNSLSFAPPSVGPGNASPDEEFEGNGPLMDAFVEFRVAGSGAAIEARVYLHAAEWVGISPTPDASTGTGPKQDYTTFDGWSPWTTFSLEEQIPDGFRIKRLLSDMQVSISFVSNYPATARRPPEVGPVADLLFFGDEEQFIDGVDDPSVVVRLHSLDVTDTLLQVELEPGE